MPILARIKVSFTMLVGLNHKDIGERIAASLSHMTKSSSDIDMQKNGYLNRVVRGNIPQRVTFFTIEETRFSSSDLLAFLLHQQGKTA